ncbi:MAG: DUF4254 domain-containing protein [Tannerellaceae bacterium]|nr:DUF4254 domain-containing protein [Tannerellaceae bacterium]
MSYSTLCISVFEEATGDYHVADSVDAAFSCPYREGSLEHHLYIKNRIDAVQWHLEDIIRNPSIDPAQALSVKRRIDRSNQERTDIVELIDSYFLSLYSGVTPGEGAPLNTESPAWAVDRLSILILKIYHMRIEAGRSDTTDAHRAGCREKLAVLIEQRDDLSLAFDCLMDDIAAGRKRIKVYRQMKMYNDPALNPVLYKKG